MLLHIILLKASQYPSELFQKSVLQWDTCHWKEDDFGDDFMDKYFLITENLQLISETSFLLVCKILTDAKNNTEKKYPDKKVLKHNITWCSNWIIENYYCSALWISHHGLQFQRMCDWSAYQLSVSQC